MKSLRLVNFKAFTDRTFDLKPLTLLSGLNSTGKSCLLQSILLLHQSYQQKLLPATGLALNGDLVSIGTGRDALNEWADEDIIAFEIIGDDGKSGIWRFQSEKDADVLPLLSPSVAETVFPSEFYYLSSCTQLTPLDYGILHRAKHGSLILLEHPEHRLHPSLASELGRQIAKSVERGVQVILETHSDHLLNGIRLAVHNGKLSPEDVALFHFQAVDFPEKREIDVQSLLINRSGRINRYPDGFFDQWDKDLEQLLEPVKI